MNATQTPPSAPARGSYASEAGRMAAINGILGERRLAASPIARCLAPMLIALDWFGSPRSLLLGLPGEGTPMRPADLGSALEPIGFLVRTRRWGSWASSGKGLHVLPVGSVLVRGESARVYLGRRDGKDWWHDGREIAEGHAPAAGDTLLLVEADPDRQPIDAPQKGWLSRLLFAARKELGGILFISLIANILALVVSLFTMYVYNAIIPSGATASMWAIAGGAVMAVAGAWALRLARVRLTSNLSAWAGNRISDLTMRKTLGLPVEVSGRMGAENNLIRLRSIEGVRQWFGGAGGVINVDYPFVVIFLFVIGLLGGWIVVVPLCGLLLFALVSWPLSLHVRARASHVGTVSRKLGEMTTVLAHRLRALRGVRGSTLWKKRVAELVSQSVMANRDHALAMGLVQAIAQTLTMATVLATMGVGILLVLKGDMNTGGLIATMMLIWRVTTPAQQFFSSQVRFKQLADASRQLEQLLTSVGEASNPKINSPVDELRPAIKADRVYYRYSADREAALGGISFDVEPGQIVAVVGPNGAGKTTLLQVLAGIRPAQNGRVLVGGRDIRQFDPAEYRGWLGYLPQEIPGLPITARESLKLRRPESTDAEMVQAVKAVLGEDWKAILGVDSEEDLLSMQIPPWRKDRQAERGRFIIRLVAAVLKSPPLLLLDDPIGDQDPALDPLLIRLLDSMRGKTTVILTTHRPDLIQRADQIAVLSDGALVHFGPVNQPPAAA